MFLNDDLTKYPYTIESDTPSLSVSCLFFGDDLLCLWLQFVQYDLQHDFAWVTDEAYCSVVLALLQVAFLGKCDD